ncbi:hypothetical protein NCAS_0H00130 [Naumovozyma castellii]|uniref:Uncharacterized protein n=1 Tax=Naumovozyma castellii TaxID=27288 RepID=G0VIJ8_NAUCA|nr:hypothetical protein NCAS_0H00130 [Naumovozyma castellii CBS 4309]CCC71323.1 hypothetical protein NCAS_0H00130 [Naumovozyma castellii CBS 4309]
MDHFKAFSIYICLHRHVYPTEQYSGTDRYFITESSNVWNWIRNTYSLLMTGCNTTKIISKPYAPDAYPIGGLKFSRQYIQAFYEDVVNRYDSNLTAIKKMYMNVLGPAEMGRKLLHTQGICLEEDRANHKDSLVNLFPQELISSFLPYPSEEKKGKEKAKEIKEEIRHAVDDMGICLMWMIYFATGGPYRFPDLQILKYAGNDRNIFFDSTERCIEIDTTYSKSRVSKRLCKVLDQHTTFHFVRHILVCRSILNNILGDFYARNDGNLFGSPGKIPLAVLDIENFQATEDDTLVNNDNNDDDDPKQLLNDEEEDKYEDEETITRFIHVFNKENNLSDLDYSRLAFYIVS